MKDAYLQALEKVMLIAIRKQVLEIQVPKGKKLLGKLNLKPLIIGMSEDEHDRWYVDGVELYYEEKANGNCEADDDRRNG